MPRCRLFRLTPPSPRCPMSHVHRRSSRAPHPSACKSVVKRVDAHVGTFTNIHRVHGSPVRRLPDLPDQTHVFSTTRRVPGVPKEPSRGQNAFRASTFDCDYDFEKTKSGFEPNSRTRQLTRRVVYLGIFSARPLRIISSFKSRFFFFVTLSNGLIRHGFLRYVSIFPPMNTYISLYL